MFCHASHLSIRLELELELKTRYDDVWNCLECSLSLVIMLLLTGTFHPVPLLAQRLDQVIRLTYSYEKVLR